MEQLRREKLISLGSVETSRLSAAQVPACFGKAQRCAKGIFNTFFEIEKNNYYIKKSRLHQFEWNSGKTFQTLITWSVADEKKKRMKKKTSFFQKIFHPKITILRLDERHEIGVGGTFIWSKQQGSISNNEVKGITFLKLIHSRMEWNDNAILCSLSMSVRQPSRLTRDPEESHSQADDDDDYSYLYWQWTLGLPCKPLWGH